MTGRAVVVPMGRLLFCLRECNAVRTWSICTQTDGGLPGRAIASGFLDGETPMTAQALRDCAAALELFLREPEEMA